MGLSPGFLPGSAVELITSARTHELDTPTTAGHRKELGGYLRAAGGNIVGAVAIVGGGTIVDSANLIPDAEGSEFWALLGVAGIIAGIKAIKDYGRARSCHSDLVASQSVIEGQVVPGSVRIIHPYQE